MKNGRNGTRVTADGGCLVRLSGPIDQHFDLRRLVEGCSGYVVLDLEDVHSITSYGVREWVRALRELPSSTYSFVHCRPSIVSNLNIVSRFAGDAQIVSFYAPYVCPECNKEIDLLIDLRRDHQIVVAGTPPSVTCSDCGSEAEFDDVPETYFGFAATRPPPILPAIVERLIDGEVTASVDRLRVFKEIEGSVTALWLSGVLDRRARLKRVVEGLEGPVVLVAQGLGETDDAGLDQLRVLFRAPDIELYLARVEPELIASMPVSDRVALVGKVISVMLGTRCTSCSKRFEIEADHEAIRRAKAGTIPVSCIHCSAAGSITLQGPSVAATVSLVTAEAPTPVIEYLQSKRSIVFPDLVQDKRRSMRPYETVTPPTAAPSRYALVRRIGAGGMAEVFLARQQGPEGFEKLIVLKRMLPDLSHDPSFVEMFLQEARIAARISHPNVVQIFDLGKEDDQFFIAMEYVRGWDLRTILRASSRTGWEMPIEFACRIVANICAGLQAAHACVDSAGNCLGIIHRDVSPHNTLISSDGSVKVADFGIAKAARSVEHTNRGETRGKLGYMSPEQMRGDPATPQSDIFAAGVILYECVVGERPFRAERTDGALSVSEQVESAIRDVRPDAPAGLARIVAKSLATATADRYATALDFQLDLEVLLAQLGRRDGATHLSRWLHDVTSAAANSASRQPLSAPPGNPGSEVSGKNVNASAQSSEGQGDDSSGTGTASSSSEETAIARTWRGGTRS